jgi:hypothetical protein
MVSIPGAYSGGAIGPISSVILSQSLKDISVIVLK